MGRAVSLRFGSKGIGKPGRLILDDHYILFFRRIDLQPGEAGLRILARGLVPAHAMSFNSPYPAPPPRPR
jgi:hypothetical protein